MLAHADPHESDEAYAARLQAVELGLVHGSAHRNYHPVNMTNPDQAATANTPLMAMVSNRFYIT